MKFHIKEKAWSFREKLIVRDEQGNPIYEIKGKFFHIGDNLVIHNLSTHEESAHIKQHVMHVTPHYEIYHQGAKWASLHEKLLHMFGERFKIKLENGEELHISGNIFNWDFTVSDSQSNLLAQIGKEISLIRDCYAVDIAKDIDVPLMIALAVVIEMVREHQSEKEDK